MAFLAVVRGSLSMWRAMWYLRGEGGRGRGGGGRGRGSRDCVYWEPMRVEATDLPCVGHSLK